MSFVNYSTVKKFVYWFKKKCACKKFCVLLLVVEAKLFFLNYYENMITDTSTVWLCWSIYAIVTLVTTLSYEKKTSCRWIWIFVLGSSCACLVKNPKGREEGINGLLICLEFCCARARKSSGQTYDWSES